MRSASDEVSWQAVRHWFDINDRLTVMEPSSLQLSDAIRARDAMQMLMLSLDVTIRSAQELPIMAKPRQVITVVDFPQFVPKNVVNSGAIPVDLYGDTSNTVSDYHHDCEKDTNSTERDSGSDLPSTVHSASLSDIAAPFSRLDTESSALALATATNTESAWMHRYSTVIWSDLDVVDKFAATIRIPTLFARSFDSDELADVMSFLLSPERSEWISEKWQTFQLPFVMSVMFGVLLTLPVMITDDAAVRIAFIVLALLSIFWLLVMWARINVRVLTAMIKRFDFWFLVVNFCMLVVAGVLMYSNDMARLLCTVHCSCIAMTIVLLDASRQSTRARMLIPSLCGIFSYILLGLYIYFMQTADQYRFLVYRNPLTDHSASFNLSTFFADRLLTFSVFCLRFIYNQYRRPNNFAMLSINMEKIPLATAVAMGYVPELSRF